MSKIFSGFLAISSDRPDRAEHKTRRVFSSGNELLKKNIITTLVNDKMEQNVPNCLYCTIEEGVILKQFYIAIPFERFTYTFF